MICCPLFLPVVRKRGVRHMLLARKSRFVLGSNARAFMGRRAKYLVLSMMLILGSLVFSTGAASAHNRGKHCTRGYSKCLHPASDYDCRGGSGDGPRYVSGPFRSWGSDPYNLDSDNDGIACE